MIVSSSAFLVATPAAAMPVDAFAKAPMGIPGFDNGSGGDLPQGELFLGSRRIGTGVVGLDTTRVVCDLTADHIRRDHQVDSGLLRMVSARSELSAYRSRARRPWTIAVSTSGVAPTTPWSCWQPEEATAGGDTFVFRLYIAGEGVNSAKALANLQVLCRKHLDRRHSIDVVDVLREPDRALADGIFTTPTLLKLTPSPLRKIVGTLSDTATLIQALGLPKAGAVGAARP